MADDDEHSPAPFRPSTGPVDQRIATALEYIAAQLGEINEKLGHMGEGEYEDEDEGEQEQPQRKR